MQWLLTFLYEYKKVFMYIGLLFLGLILVWVVSGASDSASRVEVAPTPLEQYR